MSNYWKKKLDELEKEKKNNPSGSYWDRKAVELKNEELRRKAFIKQKEEEEDDIAPIKSKEDDGKLDFFQKSSLFDDGWDFGDITKTILGSVGDAGVNAVKGVGGLVEGITDLASYGVAGVADAIGKDSFADDLRKKTQASYVDKLMKPAEDYLDKSSILGRTSDAILQGVGQIGGIMATGGLGAAGGLGAGGVTALTTGVMGLSGMGSGMGEAYKGGATDEEAVTYGAISGAADAISELIFGGLGKAVNAVGFSRGLSSADDMLAKKVSSMFSNQIAKNLSEFGIKAGAEGFEEVLAGIAQAAGKKATYMSEEEFGKILEDENLLEQFVVGAVTSGIAQAPGLHRANKTGSDFITGLNQNEQAVVKKEIENRIAEAEADGTKLTKKEKAAIEAQVEKDLEKGYISTDLIDEIVGGETYKAYKDSVDREDALFKEYEELGKTTNPTLAQQYRYRELDSRVKSIKDNDLRSRRKEHLDQFVSEQVNGSRLAESYNEKARAFEDYKADYSKYEGTKHPEAARKTIESAIKAGASNTNRVHDFVDMVAKTSADTGLTFSFQSGEQIKAEFIKGKMKEIERLEAIAEPTAEQTQKLESLKDILQKVESGKIKVNGSLYNGSIVLNLDSPKVLNRTVGHEITHSLEKAKSYDALKKSLFAYAETKGIDIASEINNRKLMYEGIAKADPEAELVSDLVGDFLFNDIEYVNKLSVENRNVFQRIYDEIKHLLKLATAGSKEARQFEKVKRNMEKAYRESRAQKNTADSGVGYALSKDADGNVFVDVTEDILDVNDGESVARTIQKVIAERFNNLIDVHGQKIQINKTTNDEFRRSNSAKGVLAGSAQAYTDKLRTIANADEILAAARNWIGEATKHQRKDDIVEFARANVMYRVGENGYIADVLVGTRKNGAAVLYDLVNIYEKKISEASVTMASDNHSQRRQNASDEQIVPQNGENVKYSLREEAPPKNTGIAYKVFFVKDGKLYPPMVANPGGADTPMGVWLNADMGTAAPPSKTGRAQVKAGGKGTQGGGGSLAFRPGWHLGDLPRASQFDRVNPETGKKELFPENFVWAEVEYAKDVDYQEEAMSYGYTDNGKFRHAYAGLPRLPENGYYRYRTNPKPDTVPWVITGAMKVNRLLSDAEVNAILEKNGVPPVHRQGGDVGLDKFGFNDDGTVKYSLSADSSGRQLSSEQREFFKDSAIRDKDGNLMVLYHGTQNAFTVFDIGRSGENYDGWSEYGEGIYLTPEKKTAQYYGDNAGRGREVNLMEVYADIKNPFSTNDPVDFDISDLAQKYELTEFDERFMKKYGNRLIEFLNHHNESVRDYLTSKGFDGVWETIDGDVYQVIAYAENQVKNVDNTKPTGNPDIRYSLSDSSEAPVASYAEIEEERQKLRQREIALEERKRKAVNDPELLQAMDDYSGLFTEVRGLLSKKRQGLATQDELDRIEEIKVLREEGLKRVSDLQESLGLNAIAEEEREIRETKEALRVASDAAWAREGAEKENKAIEKSGLSAPEYFRKKALKAFKTTTNFNEAGYLLPDGKLLNFSGGERNHRYRDHREIGEIYEATNGVAALNRFLSDGNIRVMAESPGIDLAAGVEPTAEQYAAIRKFVRTNGMTDERFFVDFSTVEGHRAGSYSYSGRVNADRVVNDIKYFFQNGKVRESSGLSDFRSISAEGTGFTPVGRNEIYGRDILKKSAPVQEEVAPVAISETETATEESSVAEMFPDDLAPVQQELDNLLAEQTELRQALESAMDQGDYNQVSRLTADYEAVTGRIRELQAQEDEQFSSLSDTDMPPEAEAPYPGEPNEPADPFAERDIVDVGNRSVKAYQYENPEVKPFFTEAALGMLYDLRNGTKGEKIFNGDVYYQSGGEEGWMGTKRQTTADIAELLDTWNYTYDQIEKGLNAIIEDDGKENNAVSKRIEFMLNDRLMNGYTGVWGEQIPANQEYINLLNEKQITEYSREAFDRFMATADQYAPPAEDIAPVQQKPGYVSTDSEQMKLPLYHDPNNVSPAMAEVQADEDIAPVFETESGQQAIFPDADVPKAVTRKELHAIIIDKIKTRFAERGFDLDAVLKNARNLSTFATVDNIPQRVMEKALGYKEGGILADFTVNKVAQNETQGIKWLNSFTDRKNGLLAQISKRYNIKPGSKESAAAQMYAEGFYVGKNNEIISYGDRELALDFPDPVKQAQIKGLARDPRIRKIYDDTLKAINESRTRNAYPEIPRLDNYFLHFRAMNDTFSQLGLPFNPNDIKAKDLPTDLNGMTVDLKPGQPFFASAMHREGKRTDFDLLGGLEQYLTSAKNQIYHIDDIQNLRALRNYIADIYGQAHGLEDLDELSQEAQFEHIKKVYNSHLSTFAKFLHDEANVLAGKTDLLDRAVEGRFGRRGLTFLDTLNRQVGANMVGYNISSSLTNLLAPVQAFAKTNKAAFIKGFAQFASNKVNSIHGNGDGFAENSPVMIRRKGAERFHRTFWQKMSDPGYVLMSAVDDISTEIIARAKYNELTRKGMDSQTAHFETDKWVSRLMGDRSLGQQPQLYNSKMLGIITKFQLEVRNQLDSQFYDTIQEAKVSNEDIQNGLLKNAKTAAKVGSTFFQLAVAQHLFGKAFESIAGYNPAFDIISAIIKTFGWDDDEEDEDTVLDNIEQGFFELMGDMPYVSTFTGGRIPIESALPIEELYKGKDQYGNEKSRWETLGEAAPYYLLPGGYGQIKKTVAGMDMFSDEHPIAGSYTDSGNLRFPVDDTLANRAQAAVFGQYASGNARDYFDNERSALKPKQIQEFIDVGMSIQDYWKYRDGLSGLSKLEEKINYINGLNLTTAQKNVLVNNLTDRKEAIDMADYDQYSSLEEFDYANKNPEKYAFFEEIGITYETYKNADDDAKKAYDWALENPDKYPMSKAVASDVVEYRRYTSELYDIKADKDSSGKSISGSRKEKVLNYINSLDIDYGERLILFKNEYNADDTYNHEIINYLNSRSDISFEEEITILRELGFTVTSDGTIYWD